MGGGGVVGWGFGVGLWCCLVRRVGFWFLCWVHWVFLGIGFGCCTGFDLGLG